VLHIRTTLSRPAVHSDVRDVSLVWGHIESSMRPIDS